MKQQKQIDVEVLHQEHPPTEVEQQRFIALLAKIIKQASERMKQSDELKKAS